MLGTYALSARLLRRLLRPRPAGAHADRRGLRRRFERFDFVVTPTAPDRRVRARRARPPTRSRCTSTTPAPCRCRSPASRRSRSRAASATACRSASSSPARRSARTRCSTRRYALERAIGFDATRRGGARHDRRVRTRHRPGDPRPARDAHEDVLRLRAVASASRRTRSPARSASACPARCRSSTRRPIHFGADDRPRAGLRDRAAVDLPPQELLLSRPAQGLPDLPVRHPALQRRPAGRRAPAPDPPRGGRGQARPRRRAGRIHGSDALDRRLQPRRHAAVRDRHRARHPLRRAGARVAEAAAHDAAPARRQRREHGGGVAALRRQRLGAARRVAASSARRPS